MLIGLRANRSWTRAIALVLLFAFTAGVLHVHASAALAASDVTGASHVHDGHGHDHDGGAPAPSVTSHCAFCAVVAGKFYVPADTIAFRVAQGVRITSWSTTMLLTSAPPADLFRPPIVRAG